MSDSTTNENADYVYIDAKRLHVSPLLEYALNQYVHNVDITYGAMYDIYVDLRRKYGCDGDELANKIYGGEIPDYIVKRNSYYHSCINSTQQ